MTKLELRWNDLKNAFDDRWMYDDDIRVTAIRFKKPKMHVHWHNEIEIVMITHGSMVIGLNSEAYNLTVGDCMIIPRNNVHYTINEDLGQASILIFDAAIFNHEDETLSAFAVPIITREIDINRFQEIFDNIYHEINNADEGYRVIVKSNICLLSGLLIRHNQRENIKRALNLNSVQTEKAQKLFKYVEDNYMNGISLADAARKMHFNSSYFSRYFKNLTGENFVKFVNAMRIQEAKNLLLSTDAKTMEIALKCGFGNMRAFTRAFKKATGLTATQYRQEKNQD